MRSLLDKRNKLNKNSRALRTIKFVQQLKREDVTVLINEQNEVYKQFIFYKEMIKAYEKEKRKEK